MTSDSWLAVATLLVGGTTGFLGVYAYIGARAPELFRRARVNAPVFIGRSIIMAFAPFGAGFGLMGVAFLVGKNAVTSDMLVAGLGFVLLGWLVFFIHPRPIQPKWLRDDPLFGGAGRPLRHGTNRHK